MDFKLLDSREVNVLVFVVFGTAYGFGKERSIKEANTRERITGVVK